MGKQEEIGTEGAEEEVSPVKKEKKKVIFDEESKDDVDIDDIDLESFGSKKKKKKKRGGEGLDNLDDLNEALPDEEEAAKDDDDDMDFNDDSFADKKKKKKKKSPDMVAGEKKKFVMRPPQVVRVGSKKTAFANFSEIAKMLHRQPKHLLAFLFAELGTSGACDGNNQLVMKGEFQQKHIENVLRRYIKEYVTCHTCRSPDTILNKETRLFFLQCMTCHSRSRYRPSRPVS